MLNIEKIKIGANGEHLPVDSMDHVAVLLPAFGLMFTRTVINQQRKPQLELEAACEAVDCADASDWYMPEIDEYELIIDRSRSGPAFDPNFFTDIPNDWLWSKTDCAWEKKDAAGRSASAWYVYARYGTVYGFHRYVGGFALAVRRVGQ